MPRSWHTRLERNLIESLGGNWEQGYGADGTLGGAPVEVRAARTDDRFRIGKDVHQELMREGGSYIFHDDRAGTEVMSASEVSALMGGGGWYEDRDYPHKFVETDEVWPRFF